MASNSLHSIICIVSQRTLRIQKIHNAVAIAGNVQQDIQGREVILNDPSDGAPIANGQGRHYAAALHL